MSDQQRSAHVQKIIEADIAVQTAKALLEETLEERDQCIRAAHGRPSEGRLTYADLMTVLDPEKNGGRNTRALSKSRLRQIVGEGG